MLREFLTFHQVLGTIILPQHHLHATRGRIKSHLHHLLNRAQVYPRPVTKKVT